MNQEKIKKTNQTLKLGIMVFSILSLIMMIGNKSYALFQNTLKTDEVVITITTVSSFAE